MCASTNPSFPNLEAILHSPGQYKYFKVLDIILGKDIAQVWLNLAGSLHLLPFVQADMMSSARGTILQPSR